MLTNSGACTILVKMSFTDADTDAVRYLVASGAGRLVAVHRPQSLVLVWEEDVAYSVCVGISEIHFFTSMELMGGGHMSKGSP